MTAIGDYAIIGDCRSAGLISRDGSLDWLCWPRFDSPSLFGALLDQAKGGRFVVQPVGSFTSERRYVGDTNVLETTFRTPSGVVQVTDLMPVCSEEQQRGELWPEHQLLRGIECQAGEVEIELVCEPRPGYARTRPRLRDRGRLGLYCECREGVLILHGDLPLTLSDDRAGARGRAVMRAGERRHVSLVYSHGEPAVIPPLGRVADGKIRTSIEWWEGWASRCTYRGPYREAVVRSALTLKLMAYAPSGALVAAPTTSLPERLGGVRNWDYRYCWLRDASLTLQALFDLGYPADAESFLAWLIHTTRISWPELRVLYDVFGSPNLEEKELGYLSGFAGSRPVRVGNAAEGQLQLDVYGEVLDAVYQFVQRGGRLDGVTRRMLVAFGHTVCRRWREPDEGIWEIRGGRRQHTYSKAMCWVALDRLLRLHAAGRLAVPAKKFEREQSAIRDQVEAHGFDRDTGSYVAVLDGDSVDASLLRLGRYGYADPTSARMQGTQATVLARLERNGLLYRYLSKDGLPTGEGAFGICSFWAVTAQAMAGDPEGAGQAFEHLLGYANDVGLFAEEIDPETGAALGNFPQAFTHVGLIDAALTLAGADRRPAHPAELPAEPAAASPANPTTPTTGRV